MTKKQPFLHKINQEGTYGLVLDTPAQEDTVLYGRQSL